MILLISAHLQVTKVRDCHVARAPKYFQNKEEALLPVKSELCRAIDRVIARNGWNYRQAALYLSTSRANLSRVESGNAEGA